MDNTKDMILSLFYLEDTDVEDISFRNLNNEAAANILLRADYPPCPDCGCTHPQIKGYTLKRINHGLLSDRKCVLFYNARRYRCPICHHTYYEHNPFVYGSMKISAMTVNNILRDLKNYNETFSSVAARYHISPTSAASIFDQHVVMARDVLPEIECWDEAYAFHNYGENSKFVFTILDFRTQNPADILPSRSKEYLEAYFSKIPNAERKKVKMISTDMYGPYRSVIHDMFPGAIHCIDHYHVTQEMGRETDAVRIRVMKSFPKYIKGTKKTTDEYYLLKKFNWLIFKRQDAKDKDNKLLFDPDRERKMNQKLGKLMNYYDIKQQIERLHPDLEAAWRLKDGLTDFYTDNDYKTAPKALDDYIYRLRRSNVREMNQFANTLRNWREEILNSFIVVKQTMRVDKDTGQVVVSDHRINSGIMENRNSILKCIKKNANGYSNWERFRNRCLYVLRKDALPLLNPIKIPAKRKKEENK